MRNFLGSLFVVPLGVSQEDFSKKLSSINDLIESKFPLFFGWNPKTIFIFSTYRFSKIFYIVFPYFRWLPWIFFYNFWTFYTKKKAIMNTDVRDRKGWKERVRRKGIVYFEKGTKYIKIFFVKMNDCVCFYG